MFHRHYNKFSVTYFPKKTPNCSIIGEYVNFPFFVMKNSVFLQAKNLEHDLADSERNAKSCISGKKEGLFLWNKCFYQQR